MNPDQREMEIRRMVYEHLAQFAHLSDENAIIATYFVVSSAKPLDQVGKELVYHQTSGIKNPPEGLLVAECTGHFIDRIAFDGSERVGLVRVSFPLKMFLDDEGKTYSTEILHVTAGAGIFALREFPDIKLVNLDLPKNVVESFPGPAYGSEGIRDYKEFSGEIAFGTIIKPCSGITPGEVAEKIGIAAKNSIFLFVKEDEELFPNAAFCPLGERVKLSVTAIKEAAAERGGGEIIYAPHIGTAPHRLIKNLETAVENGATGVMFSEYNIGGAFRWVRDTLAGWGKPLVIYGHNGGISTRTRHIWREVLDYLARLDGIDIRQTGVAGENSILRPFGQEWRKVEEILTRPIPGIKPVLIARAGGLDQGNIILNLQDIVEHGSVNNYMLLAGSAINGFKDEDGIENPKKGATAMMQAVEAFKDDDFDNSSDRHVQRLAEYAEKTGCQELRQALRNRYSE